MGNAREGEIVVATDNRGTTVVREVEAECLEALVVPGMAGGTDYDAHFQELAGAMSAGADWLREQAERGSEHCRRMLAEGARVYRPSAVTQAAADGSLFDGKNYRPMCPECSRWCDCGP